jgi:hypothetical protein
MRSSRTRVGLALHVKELMNTRSNHNLAILLAFTILLAIACNSITLFPKPTPSLLHFENKFVAFDYMEGMNLYEGGDEAFQCIPDFLLGGELVVGLGGLKFPGSDYYFRSIRIFRQPMPSDSNLETIMQNAYQEVETFFPSVKDVRDPTGSVTVAGLSAFQRTYPVYIGEPAYVLRDVWIPKDDELFIVSIWTQYTNSDGFAAFQAGADLLLNSLRIK